MRPVLTLVVILALGACEPIVRTHGYVPSRSNIEALVPGVDTKLSVADAIGRPSDIGLRDGQSWYYVSNTVSNYMFLEPETLERTVLALDFDGDDVLTGVNEYGLEDGQVIELTTRITPTDRRRRNILDQLFGNIGSITPPLPGQGGL